MALSSLFYMEIRQNPLFNRLSDDCFQLILRHSGLLTLNKNELLFECGATANRFFMIRSGQIALFQVSTDGYEKIVDIIETGQIFAEAILFTHERRYPINARAVCGTELFYFDAQSFKGQLLQSSDLCMFMMAEMSSRLTAQTHEIVQLSIYDAQYRLINYLLEKSCKNKTLSCKPVVVLSATKSLLASRLSITPETFSRILARLKKQGLITIEDDTIILNDCQKLRHLINLSDSELPVESNNSDLNRAEEQPFCPCSEFL